MMTTNLFKKIIISAVAALTLASCVNSDKANTRTAVKEEKTQVQGKAIFSIDKQIIYEDDFFDFSSNVLKEMDKESYSNQPLREKLLRDFLEHKILLAEAKRKNIQIDDKRISAVLDSFRSAEGAQDLKVYTGSYGTDQEKLAKTLEERLLVETLLNNIVNQNIVISEKDMQEYFKKNPKIAQSEAKANIFHIFTKEKDTADRAMAELKRGVAFSEVAERYSEGPEKASGGDLGLVADSDFPEIFAEAFKLREGRTGPIVKSDYGFHIFLVKKYVKAKKITFTEAKPKIYYELYVTEQENKTREYIDELYSNTNIKIINDIDFNNFSEHSIR